MVNWNLLTIDSVKPLDNTCRNLKVDLSKIDAGGDIVRLANGTRRSLRRRIFDKYKVSLSGDAVRKPALDHLARGDTVALGLPVHIDLPGDVADNALPRTAVAGSIVRVGEVDGQPVALAHGDPGILVTAFRPVLTIMIDDIQINEDVQNAKVSWSITGEEV